MRVYADLQATQSPNSARRGIGRYVLEYARAMQRDHPDGVSSWMLSPQYPVPAELASLLPGGGVRFADDPDLTPPDVFHVLSPFEQTHRVSASEIWPEWARGHGTRLVVTLYDLIPFLYPEHYLGDRAVRRDFEARRELIERADRVLAISEATARDAVKMLKIPSSRIDVVGTGVSDHFRPASDAIAVLRRVQLEFPSVRPGYMMYTGGIDFRKNIDGLLDAYAKLPRTVRAAHQLLIVCKTTPDEHRALLARGERLGLGPDLVLTGFVSDESLLSLYQAAHLFIFPSLYEGFGLPVVEALGCGVPAIVGENSSLTELVSDPLGWFDATSTDAIAAAILRVLTDEEVRARLTPNGGQRAFSWDLVAERSLESYRRAYHAGRGGSRPRVALVSPMPPDASGVADYSARLLDELRKLVDVEVFTSRSADRPRMLGVRWFDYDEFAGRLAVGGRPELVVYAMGNSEFHFDVLRLLRQHGGTVIAHDVRYTNLFSSAIERAPELIDEGISSVIDRLLSGSLPDDALAASSDDYYRMNDFLIQPVVEAADIVFVHSETAKSLARLNIRPELRPRVMRLPFGMTARGASRSSSRDLVASFGMVDPIKQSELVLEVFLELAHRHHELRFALVGASPDPSYLPKLADIVAQAGLEDRISLTGRVDEVEYAEFLSRCRLAVQLRDRSNGESSAAVGDCLGAGVPTIVSRVGSMAELGDAVASVGPEETTADVIELAHSLLGNADVLASLGERGKALASTEHGFPLAARALARLARSSASM